MNVQPTKDECSTYKDECSTYKGTILFSISAQGSLIISPFLDMCFKFSSFIILFGRKAAIYTENQ